MQYDQFIEIETYTASTDAWGTPSVKSWSVTGKLYGAVMTERGKEFVSEGSSDTARKRISVITFYRDDIPTNARLDWQGEKYEVTGVVLNVRKNETQINALWTEGRG